MKNNKKKIDSIVVMSSLLLLISDIVIRFVLVNMSQNLTCVMNSGIAFGFSLLNEELVSIIALSLIFIYLLLFCKTSQSSLSMRVYLGLVWVFGAVNFIDRLFRGAVCDYVNISMIRLSFNLADVGITVLVTILIYKTLFNESITNRSKRS